MVRTDDARQARLKELLQEEKRKLWNELRVDLFDKLGADMNKQYDIPQDLGDRGVLDQLEDIGLSVADIQSEHLTLIDGALLKIENGSYGICDDCGKEIDEARLRVYPYAACCAVCQQRREIPGKTSVSY